MIYKVGIFFIFWSCQRWLFMLSDKRRCRTRRRKMAELDGCPNYLEILTLYMYLICIWANHIVSKYNRKIQNYILTARCWIRSMSWNEYFTHRYTYIEALLIFVANVVRTISLVSRAPVIYSSQWLYLIRVEHFALESPATINVWGCLWFMINFMVLTHACEVIHPNLFI